VKRLDEETALAIVFANTRRKKRTEHLVRVAEALDFLIGLYGSQRKVAQRVNLSPEMVREFRSILRLPQDVKELIRARRIDDLDSAYRISMMRSPKMQRELASQVAELDTQDVRDVGRLISTAGKSARESAKAVLASKLKGLHVFAIDFEDDEYHAIVRAAREKTLDPAALLRQVILRWLARQTRKLSGKR